MKRVVIRVVTLLIVVVGGLGAVTQAQRVLRSRAPGEVPPTAEAIEAARLAAAATAGAEDSSADDTPFARSEGGSPSDSSQPVQYTSSALLDVGESDSAASYTERPLPEDGAQPAGNHDAAEYADEATGRVRPAAYDEPVDLVPVPEGGAESGSTDLEPVEGGAMPEVGEVDPGSAYPLEEPPPTSAVEEEATPADVPAPETQPVGTSSRRRAVDAMGKPARPESYSVDEQPLQPVDESADPAAQDNFRPAAAATNPLPQAGDPAVEGLGRPGEAQLEGRQSHGLELEKQFPSDAQVGKPTQIDIKVRNSGAAAARSLEIVDTVPQGTRLVATRPQADVSSQGEVRWAIAALKPGEEATVTMEVLPMVEGELGSVAMVRYAAEASARAVVTRPVVALEVSGPKQVTVGEEAPLVVKVSNNGSGVAMGVFLSEMIPEGLTHPAGSELEYEIGDLRPGESREVRLTLNTEKAGRYANTIVARGEGEAQAESRTELEVIAPALTLELAGGARRYLEKPAKFTLSVANDGTAPAKALEITAQLPNGLEFMEATHYGEYDPQTHVVHWSLEQLPAGQVGSVELTVRPTAEGEQKIVLRATGEPLAKVEKEQVISVEGIATTLFEVVDVEDPIEANGETSYEIRVVNQGTKGATNVQVVAVLPDGLQAIDAEGPSRYQIDGQRVLFDPLERLAPKADTSYRLRVKAVRTGEMRVQVQLMTGEMRSPITEEESTQVYSNE